MFDAITSSRYISKMKLPNEVINRLLPSGSHAIYCDTNIREADVKRALCGLLNRALKERNRDTDLLRNCKYQKSEACCFDELKKWCTELGREIPKIARVALAHEMSLLRTWE